MPYSQTSAKMGQFTKNLAKFHSGKGESEGREFVSNVCHKVVYSDRKKPPPFVAAEYAKEMCIHALFEYFYSHYVVWTIPPTKVLHICELKKIGNNREEDADEEASAEKAGASTTTANTEPRTAEKDEGRNKPKRVEREGRKSQLSKRQIENERIHLQNVSVEAKAKIALIVEKQNELTAESNKHAIAKTVLESGIATEEQKKKAVETLIGFL